MKGFSLKDFKSFVEKVSPEKISNEVKNATISVTKFAKENGIKDYKEAASIYVERFGEETISEVFRGDSTEKAKARKEEKAQQNNGESER